MQPFSLQSHSRPSLQHIKQRMCQVPVYNMPVKCVVILYCMRPRPGELYRVVQAVLVGSVLGGYKQIGGYKQV